MGNINVLSFAVANLIAAGEVVDRPASVIKELLENAVDAGATRITVEIQHGGITLMRVSDNGCGMTAEDLPISIRRHATSKIRNAADLDRITTLGFRGEALAAIAAVSDLRIITRTADALSGSCLTASGGNILGVTEQGCSVGTTVIVENLFANVPARRKFLRRDVTEAISVTAYTEKIALSRPDIAFRLIVDGSVRLETAGDGELKSAMYAVLGRETASKMIPVQGAGEGIAVEGFIGRPDLYRPKRTLENFFLNGRYVNSRTMAAALEQAYVSFLASEKFPCCVLKLSINPAAVDVNVHPAKLEVKFSSERPVFETVYSAVRTALEHNTVRPEIQLSPNPKQAFVPIEDGKPSAVQLALSGLTNKETGFSRLSSEEYRQHMFRAQAPCAYRQAAETSGALKNSITASGMAQHAETRTTTVENIHSEYPSHPDQVASEHYSHAEKISFPAQCADLFRKGKHRETDADMQSHVAPAASPCADTAQTCPDFRVIGEAFYSYVIVESGDRLLLIDKHAAHERVLFEELKKGLTTGSAVTQILLLPMQLSMTVSEAETLCNFRDEITEIGFVFACEGGTVSVSEIPEGLSPAQAREFLLSLPEGLSAGTGNATLSRSIFFEKALYQSACKAAIKAGRDYPPEYVQWLCKKLFELPDITVCPHGRPVAVILSHEELDRRFRRT